MTFNMLTFGLSFFIQQNGIAMGTNAVCMYAVIYYSYHKKLSNKPFIKFNNCLIINTLIIIDNSAWNFEELQLAKDNFGPIGKRHE